MIEVYLLCLMLNATPRHCALVQEIAVGKKYGYEVPTGQCYAGDVYFRRPRDPLASNDVGDFWFCQGEQSPFLPQWVKVIINR